MKISLAVALFAGVVQPTELAKDTQPMVEITEGFLLGALDAEGFTDIEKCIQDGEHIVKDAEAAYTDFKSKDPEEIVDGLKQIADALLTVKAGMQDCSSVKADWEKLAKMAAVFSSPSSFAWHASKDLFVNGVEITKEIKTAVADYEGKQWKDFGYQTGKAAAQVILGKESQEQLARLEKEKVALTYKGILENFGGHFSLQNLLVCIHDEDQAALMIDAAVQQFEEAWEKKELEAAVGGVVVLVGGYQQFKAGLPVCEAVDTATFDYKQFDQTMDIGANPLNHFTTMDVDLQVHGHSILEDIGAGVDAYRSGDYETFGKRMGAIIKLSTSPMPKEAPKATFAF